MVSKAKEAVDSTLRRILNYTTEIIMSIILLIVICIPLIFAIPIWIQVVLFGVARPLTSVNPVAWFGLDGAIWITLLLGLVSFGISYFYILKMKPGIISADIEDEEVEKGEDLESVVANVVADAEEETALDQEEEQEVLLEDQEEELETEDILLEEEED